MKANQLTRMALAIGASLMLSTAMAATTPEPPIYGSQLMTQQERIEFRDKLRTATTQAERDKIRLEHHDQMKARAAAKGITLPDEPPMRGAGMGPGAGPGMGQGAGTGQGAGNGPGGGAGPGGGPGGGGRGGK